MVGGGGRENRRRFAVSVRGPAEPPVAADLDAGQLSHVRLRGDFAERFFSRARGLRSDFGEAVWSSASPPSDDGSSRDIRPSEAIR